MTWNKITLTSLNPEMLTESLCKFLCPLLLAVLLPSCEAVGHKGAPVPWVKTIGRCSHQHKGGREERWGGSQEETTPKATTKVQALLFLLLHRGHTHPPPKSSLHWRVVRRWGEEVLCFLTQDSEQSLGLLIYGQWATFLFYFISFMFMD